MKDSAGTVVAKYSYDAWGKLLSVTDPTDIANLNPFRYRGYYYDIESGFYYLTTRYYDAEVGRFLNADDISYLGADGAISGFNLFAYCSNNPIMNSDPLGLMSTALKIGLTVGVVAGCIVIAALTGGTALVLVVAISTTLAAADGGLSAYVSGGDVLTGVCAGAAGGAVGGLVGSGGGIGLSLAGRAASSTIYDLGYAYLENDKISSEDISLAAVDVTMDVTYSIISYDYASSIGNRYIQTTVNGLVDGSIDVFQSATFFNPNFIMNPTISNSRGPKQSQSTHGRGMNKLFAF